MSREKQYHPGLLGKKLGMAHMFTAEGECVPLTVIQAGPCVVLEVKQQEQHGYSAVQFGFEPKKVQRSNKASMGHFAKAGQGAFYHVREVRCDVNALGWTTPGQAVKVSDLFKEGEFVDVSGQSIGRGFSGVVRRFGVKGQPATRGTHEYRRHIGAVGCRKFPGHIFKNKRMPGHMGVDNITIQNLRVMGVKDADNVLLVRGAVPGARGALLVIRKRAAKAAGAQSMVKSVPKMKKAA